MIELDFEKSLEGNGGKFVLKVSLKLPLGKFISIFGRSGVGKTTILRIIAGLETPDKGRILVGTRVYFDSQKNINLPPQARNIGFVFQNYVLFPHLDVYENIIFGHRKDKKRVQEVIELMDLKGLCEKRIHTLSGGQAQRVALARALVRCGDILLLDEPLSAIDGQMRSILQEELRSTSEHFGISTFLVSHDIGEVFRLSDEVICIEDGRVAKKGSPNEVFLNDAFSAKLQLSGEILDMAKDSLVPIASVLINGSIIKVVLSPLEASKFQIGDRVMVVAKAFSPLMVPL